MKRQILIFNNLLRSYNRFRAKLRRLISRGINARKQDILTRRIATMQTNLLSMQKTIRLATATAAVVGATAILQPNSASAQSFTSIVKNPLSSVIDSNYSLKPSFVDIDADGDMDAFIGKTTGEIQYYRNDGSTSTPYFNKITGIENPLDGFGITNGWASPTFVDIDNDGDMDAFIGNNAGYIQFFENTGAADSPAFTEITDSKNPLNGIKVGSNNATPSFVDMNNDGLFDAVIGNYEGTLSYFENTGTKSTPILTQRTGIANPLGTIDVGSNSISSFYDYDNDGDFDAFVGDLTGVIHFYKNEGTKTNPSFAEQTGTLNPLSSVNVNINSAPSFVDINNDGFQDVFIGSYQDGIPLYSNVGGKFIPENSLSTINVGTYNSTPAFADIDEDGDLDLFIGSNIGTIQYYENVAGVFTQNDSPSRPFYDINLGFKTTPSFADIDKDGDIDAFIETSDGIVHYFENNSKVLTEQPGSNPFDIILEGGSTLRFADIDNDGDMDAIVGNFKTISYYKNNAGNFTELTGSDNPFNNISGFYYLSPSFADLDEDGDLDLILGNYNGTLSFFKNTNGTFSQVNDPLYNVIVGNFNSPAFVDIDNDGVVEGIIGTGSGSIYLAESTTNKWTGSSDNDWHNAENWSKGANPSLNQAVIIPEAANSPIISSSNQGQCSNLHIESKANLTVNTGKSLFVQNDITLHSNTTGTASLIDDNNVSLAGLITVEQYLTAGRNWYISSPNIGSTSASIIDETGSTLWQYNEETPAWEEIIDNTTSLNYMSGYVANKASNGIIAFTAPGTNTGSIIKGHLMNSALAGSKRGFNLIGNPYPSCVSWDMADISGVDSSIWYRTQTAGKVYVFDTYNSKSKIGTNNNGKAAVTGIIPQMQAVWVHVKDNQTGSVTFDNTMRSHASSGNKLKADVSTNDIIRLQVANGKNTDEAIIVFNQEASNAYDAWDSKKMFSESATIPQLYTTANTEKLVINGLESVVKNSIIPLGFKTNKSGIFTISANEISGVDGVILEDKLLNKTQDLSASTSYTFSSDSVDNASRFALRLKADSGPFSPSNNVSSSIIENKIKIFTKDHSVIIETSETETGIATIYDVLGNKIAQTALTGTKTSLELPAIVGAYFIKVEGSKSVETKKIIVE